MMEFIMYAFMRHVTKHTARSEVHSICCGVTLATHCNTLQHTATHCNTLQHTKRRNIYFSMECFLQQTYMYSMFVVSL